MNDSLYAKVSEPSEIRKELLGSTKKVIEALRVHEQYRLIRLEKHTLMAEAKELSEIIASNMRKLKTHFPKADIKIKKPERAEVKKPEAKELPKTVKKPQKSKLELLEEELSKIEAKLSSLQ